MTPVDAALVRFFDSTEYQLLAVLVALGVGAAHAVAPGHGKSVAAAYLVGTHGRYRDAAYLGGVVAVMHTVSSLVLAVAWVSFSSVAGAGTETVTAVMQVVAGLAVVAVGWHLVVRRRRHARGRRRAREHAHAGHGHGHGHGHSHTVPAPEALFSRRGLVALGLSGGLLPSPSAFLVLVSGLLTGRIGFALLLVALFGVGLAATLTAVGALVLKGKSVVDARSGGSAALTRLSLVIPVAAAYLVVAGGVLYVGAAVRTLI